MRGKIVRLGILALLLLILASIVSMASSDLRVPWYVMGGGGGESANGRYALEGTIGQSVSGMSSGGHYQLCAGYWCSPAPEWHNYLPQLNKTQP
ncbi:MAG: hypothetical protein GXO55_07715 [Chloroflexi bacterium]|nr:hypothetical protein [Chloroflexota bacterium]